MFLVRYFLYAGSALLGLLLFLTWYFPAVQTNVADQGREASINKEILRIRSAQKWPEKIVFDTDIPTIVPPPAPLVASIPPAPQPPFKSADAGNKSPLNARAEAKPAQAEAKRVQAQRPPRKLAAVRHRTYRPPPPQFGAYPVASAWSPWW